MPFILQWIDLIWLPIGLVMVHKHQRTWAAGFFVGCMLMMRLQIELMESTGYAHGFVPVMSSYVGTRALMVYSVCYGIYIAFAIYSPGTKGTMLMAASISMFFMALFTSMIIMVL